MSQTPKLPTIVEPTLILDGSWGIYIPQMFGTRYLTEADCKRCDIDIEYARALGNIESDLYWEAWESVLDNYSTELGETLYQDQDVWLVPAGFKWPDDGM
jgi:hypothetical protein